jgi:hypothetical protein
MRMKARAIITMMWVLIACTISFSYGQENANGPSKFSVGALTGYNMGYGVQTNFALHQSASGLPFDLRLGLGYTWMNPGDALEARRVFINNNTNGTPEKAGRSIDYRLDFMLPKSIFGLKQSYIVLGPRGSSFKGNFAYIGGNEEFDVISSQWGLGGGIQSHFSMVKNLTLVVAAGLDYYFPSTLHGHDTSYSPDNDNVNPRNDNQNDDEPFTYKDADKAISQPRWMPYAMIGVTYSF